MDIVFVSNISIFSQCLTFYKKTNKHIYLRSKEIACTPHRYLHAGKIIFHQSLFKSHPVSPLNKCKTSFPNCLLKDCNKPILCSSLTLNYFRFEEDFEFDFATVFFPPPDRKFVIISDISGMVCLEFRTFICCCISCFCF